MRTSELVLVGVDVDNAAVALVDADVEEFVAAVTVFVAFGPAKSLGMALLNFNLAQRDTSCRSHLTDAVALLGASETTQMAT